MNHSKIGVYANILPHQKHTPGQKLCLLHRATDVSIQIYAENYRRSTEICGNSANPP